jgi:ribosomal protein S18 acetylase RimI-like enzyme
VSGAPAAAIMPLTAATLDAAVRLCERVFPWNRPEVGDGLRAVLAPHRHPAEILERASFDRTCWVALLDGEVVGAIGLFRQLEDFRTALHLGWFAVAPEVRRQGIGSRLLRHAIGEAEASGVGFLRLETSDSGDERLAQPLYEAFGFAVTRTRENAWGKAHWTTIWREKPLRLDTAAVAPEKT